MTPVWTLEEASQLSRIIDDAMMIGPQQIARNGDPLVIVVASRQWDEMNRKPQTAAILQINQMQTGSLKNFICG